VTVVVSEWYFSYQDTDGAEGRLEFEDPDGVTPGALDPEWGPVPGSPVG
jgi:hypothetical protein